jgi:hypothetical protein
MWRHAILLIIQLICWGDKRDYLSRAWFVTIEVRMATQDVNCDQLMTWWELKADIAFIFSFNWTTVGELREAIAMFLSARLHHLACQASEKLAENGSRSTKLLLASNPSSPDELLDYLTEIGSTEITIRVAENSACGARTLERLSGHPCSSVRRAVAENRNTKEACLLKLAHDPDADIRFCMAENPHLPLSVLNLLMQDENPYVSQRTRKTVARLLDNATALPNEPKEVSSKTLEIKPYDGMFARELMAEIQAIYDSCPSEISDCTYQFGS